MLLPVLAVVFSFVVNVLSDIRKYHKFNATRLIDHATKMAMYLGAIGMLECLAYFNHSMSQTVIYFASVFAGAEILGTIGVMRDSLKGDPSGDVLDETLQQVDPFAILMQEKPSQNPKK